MARAIWLVMDSFGIGATADAHRYGDEAANTFGNIVASCVNGRLSERTRPLHIPNLTQLGLVQAACDSHPMFAQQAENYGLDMQTTPTGAFGFAEELSLGKDTPSGHWEMAGVPALFEWGYFPKQVPCFPDALIETFIEQGNIPGVLGNTHASGTTIIEELGATHIETGKPIVYTSADSVFQIAAHEQHFGLSKLYELCELARGLVDEHNVGRVIARPFVGEAGYFTRTGNRRDYAIPPPQPTLLDRLKSAGHDVYAIGKISDIFSGRGVTHVVKAHGNDALFQATLDTLDSAPDGSLIFTNFVDFDMLYGHRRDIAGYAQALEDFDRLLPSLLKKLHADDMVIITADHGCDPTFDGSDHTREHVPVLCFGPNIHAGRLGKRTSFADMGQTIASHLALSPLEHGNSFYTEVCNPK